MVVLDVEAVVAEVAGVVEVAEDVAVEAAEVEGVVGHLA